MSMTREDVLRELELLPVWQLRLPAAPPIALSVKEVQKIAEVQIIAEVQQYIEFKVAEVTEKPQASPAVVAETSHYLLISDDKNWAFVLPQALTGAAQALFNNILLALQLNKTHAKTLANLFEIKSDVKVIVAMGELTAQQLLNSLEPIEALRGKVHKFEHVPGNIPLVVTYHPNDLLQHLAYKAKMWDDLCMAKALAST